MERTEILEATKAIVKAATIPEDRARIRPLFESKIYRGKSRFVVGYSWSKITASMYSGMVYDCILGYGDTPGEAIENARNKLKL